MKSWLTVGRKKENVPDVRRNYYEKSFKELSFRRRYSLFDLKRKSDRRAVEVRQNRKRKNWIYNH